MNDIKKLKAGDVVALMSNTVKLQKNDEITVRGPEHYLTVTDARSNSAIKCTYMCDGEYNAVSIPIECLVLIAPENYLSN